MNHSHAATSKDAANARCRRGSPCGGLLAVSNERRAETSLALNPHGYTDGWQAEIKRYSGPQQPKADGRVLPGGVGYYIAGDAR